MASWAVSKVSISRTLTQPVDRHDPSMQTAKTENNPCGVLLPTTLRQTVPRNVGNTRSPGAPDNPNMWERKRNQTMKQCRRVDQMSATGLVRSKQKYGSFLCGMSSGATTHAPDVNHGESPRCAWRWAGGKQERKRAGGGKYCQCRELQDHAEQRGGDNKNHKHKQCGRTCLKN